MKKLTLLASSVILALAASSSSYADLSANITATNDYVWRGISQTGNGSAVQGGLDYTEGGFFAGTWISNTSGTSETDLYFGYGGEAGDFGYSAMFIHYWYPSAQGDSDFGEIALDFSYGLLSFGTALTVVSQIDDDTAAFAEGDIYYYVGISGNVEETWNLSATYGFYDFDADGLAGVGDISYGYFEVAATKDLGDFGEIAIALSIADDEAANVGNANGDEAITRISWSKSF